MSNELFGSESRGAVSRSELREVAQGLRNIAIEHNALKYGPAVTAQVAPQITEMSARSFSEGAVSLLEKLTVTAVGINERDSTVFVYVNRRPTQRDLKGLPDSLPDGVQIQYRQAKPLVIGGDAPPSAMGLVGPVKHRIRCGTSISVGNEREAGTFGALVRDREGRLLGLSNNHVTGGCNNARVGLPIIAPGVLDVQAGHPNPQTIGLHHSVIAMRPGSPSIVDPADNTDAALFEIVDPKAVSSFQGEEYDTPIHVEDPMEGMQVEKVGRTTGHTQGVIESELVGGLPVAYKTRTYHSANDYSDFVASVYFDPVFLVRGKAQPFSLPGDSGSLTTAVAQDGQRASVGLVFAGMLPDTSYIVPIRPILERLDVSLVEEHNANEI